MRTHPLVPVLLAAGLAACANERSPVAPQLSAGAAPHASLSENPGCKSVAGTVYGKFVGSPEAAWVGTVLVSFGGGPMERATFVARSNEIDIDRASQGKPFRGKETWTLTFSHGSFDIVAEFVAIPASTPGLYQLNDSGDVANGTGQFAGASGRVTVHGPFIAPPVDPEPLAIGQMHASVCGIG